MAKIRHKKGETEARLAIRAVPFSFMRRENMRKSLILAATATLALTACSQNETGQSDAAMEESTAPSATEAVAAEAASEDDPLPALADIPVNLPQLAYVYDYRWRLPGDEIGGLQRRHASLCEQQGPTICQITGMTKTGEDDGTVSGELRMAVATRQARAFGALLEDEAEDAGADAIAAEIASEELSKQLVDTEARLRSRVELRDRLQDVLRNRKGKVADLIEAERSVAAVNEEIDAARSWLKEMEGRVAYSQVSVHYETGTPVARDFFGPVSGALGSLGSIFGFIVAFLILAGAVVLPTIGVWWVGRRLSGRLAAPLPQSDKA
jgi:Domain of unknown function (DUF4349)